MTLPTICSACGFANPAQRYCGGCGATLRPPASTDAVRKIVTVVFVDLVGSTALGERLEPELLRHVLSRYVDVARAVFVRHGGTVEKFIGDAVMAVFGVPVVHEDDALRAVCAALEVRAALERLNVDLAREYGERLVTRTGVNTGETVVGGVDSPSDQRLAIGDAVNIAARLEQGAAAGDILLGETTFATVRHAVEAEPVRPIDAKGKLHALRAWRLVSVRPDAPPIAPSVRTSLIGRHTELAHLRRLFDDVVRLRSCRMATIVAAPGTGKSRLARELLLTVASEARVLTARCAALALGSSLLPLADAVRDAVGGPDVLAGLSSLLRTTERGDVAARLVAMSVGSGSAAEGAGPQGLAASPEETAWAFRRLFEAFAAQGPVVILVDDIHWAEPALLDLLEYLVAFSSDGPILIVCLARPDLLESRPTWAAPRDEAILVTLPPLGTTDAASLVDALQPDSPLPSELRRRIVDKAEGNPLFVEQMVAMLADDPAAAMDAIPPTIHALLAARLERLPTVERTVLQLASIEGRRFHRGAVATLAGSGGSTGLGSTLLTLARKEFVRPERSTVAGDDGFRFNHALIRDVAYASLTKEARAQLHARLADWLDGSGVSPSLRDDLVGHHLEQACLHRRELGRVDEITVDLGRRAGERLLASGRRALERGEPAVASTSFVRARRLFDEGGLARSGLLPMMASALRWNGSLDAAEEAAAAGIEAARALDDPINEQRARVEHAQVSFLRGTMDAQALRSTARHAIAIFEEHGSDADLADAWHLMGSAELSAGDRGAQLAALKRGRAHAVASGDVRRQIDAWNEVGGAMLFGSTPLADVLPFIEDELAWARAHGLAVVEADALLGGPYLLARLGDFGEARARLERSKLLARELGIRYGLAEAHIAGAMMELMAGDPPAAERELRDAIALVVAMGSARYAALCRTRLAHVLLTLGRVDDAQVELDAAHERVGHAASWKMARARVLASKGDLAEAIALSLEAVDSMASSDDLTSRAEMHVHRAEVLSAGGDSASAATALAEAAALHERKGNVLPARQCRERLAAIASSADLTPASGT